jgi:hypothetical protein
VQVRAFARRKSAISIGLADLSRGDSVKCKQPNQSRSGERAWWAITSFDACPSDI